MPKSPTAAKAADANAAHAKGADAAPSASPSSTQSVLPDTTLSLPEQLQERADTLFRTAVETCRQHRRYAALVDMGARDVEQKAALKLAVLCDTMLVESIASYERCGARVQGLEETTWWRKANALWHQSREYERRHQITERASRLLNAQHDSQMLGELRMEYDLEASALLMLQQAIDEYRKVRPEAQIHC